MPSGGYRKPNNPAPASGPGRLSKRTDGGPSQAQRDLPNAEYGEGKAYSEVAGGAPMAMADGALSPDGSQTPSPMSVTPFGAPSSRPDQPITAGADMGAGPGPDVLGLVTPPVLQAKDREVLADYLPVLEYLANLPTGMPSLRALVRKVKGTVGR